MLSPSGKFRPPKATNTLLKPVAGPSNFWSAAFAPHEEPRTAKPAVLATRYAGRANPQPVGIGCRYSLGLRFAGDGNDSPGRPFSASSDTANTTTQTRSSQKNTPRGSMTGTRGL